MEFEYKNQSHQQSSEDFFVIFLISKEYYNGFIFFFYNLLFKIMPNFVFQAKAPLTSIEFIKY